MLILLLLLLRCISRHRAQRSFLWICKDLCIQQTRILYRYTRNFILHLRWIKAFTGITIWRSTVWSDRLILWMTAMRNRVERGNVEGMIDSKVLFNRISIGNRNCLKTNSLKSNVPSNVPRRNPTAADCRSPRTKWICGLYTDTPFFSHWPTLEFRLLSCSLRGFLPWRDNEEH